MKENIGAKPENFKTTRKFWQPSQNLISPKASFQKFIDHAKTTSRNKYKAKLIKLEQQYNDIHMAFSSQNSILRGILQRNLSLTSKASSNRSSNFFILKCLLAGGVVYGTIYAGFWGSPTDSNKMVEQVVNREFGKTNTDMINDAVKFIGEHVQNFPENSGYFISETQNIILDCYEHVKQKFRSE